MAAVLTPKQRKLYEIVRSAGQLGITCRDLMNRLYADDPDGGPDSQNVVQVHTSFANKRLKAFGFAIRGRGGHGSVYRLVKL